MTRATAKQLDALKARGGAAITVYGAHGAFGLCLGLLSNKHPEIADDILSTMEGRRAHEVMREFGLAVHLVNEEEVKR